MVSSTTIDQSPKPRASRMVVRKSGQFGWSDGAPIALMPRPLSPRENGRDRFERSSRAFHARSIEGQTARNAQGFSPLFLVHLGAKSVSPFVSISRASPIFSSHYRFRLCLREWAAVQIRCAGTRACGDDGRRGCRLAVVERCRNRTLFMASAEDPGKFRTTVYKTEQLCCASRSTAYLECLRRAG